MARFIVERSFPDGFHIPVCEDGAVTCPGMTCKNAATGVTWIHSYVSEDKKFSFCLYDGPGPESIRLAAARVGLPVKRITRVTVLDPYFYR